MKKIIAASIIATLLGFSARAYAASFAASVVDYTPGTLVNSEWDNSQPFNNSNAVLGKPKDIVAGIPVFSMSDSVLSPFSPHYEVDSLTGVGYGGQLTLQLQNYVTVSSGAFEIGVWTDIGIADSSYPNGTAGSPASTFSSPSGVVVSVSADGVHWVALNGGNPMTFSNPGNYYLNAGPYDTTVPASPVLADFGKPFTGTLASFSGETYSQVLSTLNGSAGGTWLDLDSTGLSEVGYIRFNGVASGGEIDLNAVSINSSLAGATVPEPGTVGMLVLGAAFAFGIKRRR